MILAAGDSFVYGSELADVTSIVPSKNTFTALLGATETVAWPGYGNDSIARTVIERCEQGDVTGVVTSWTFPGRYEFRFNYNTYQRKSPWYTINSWTSNLDIENIKKEFFNQDEKTSKHLLDNALRAKNLGINDFARVFYQHVGNSEYWEIYSSLKEIVYLQNYLKLKSIPYMFTCADTYMFYHNTEIDATLKSLFGQIDFDKWYFFPEGAEWETTTPRGFYQWAVENKYPMGAMHPLEPAHLAAAELMKEKFNELVKKSIQPSGA